MKAPIKIKDTTHELNTRIEPVIKIKLIFQDILSNQNNKLESNPCIHQSCNFHIQPIVIQRIDKIWRNGFVILHAIMQWESFISDEFSGVYSIQGSWLMKDLIILNALLIFLRENFTHWQKLKSFFPSVWAAIFYFNLFVFELNFHM